MAVISVPLLSIPGLGGVRHVAASATIMGDPVAITRESAVIKTTEAQQTHSSPQNLVSNDGNATAAASISSSQSSAASSSSASTSSSASSAASESSESASTDTSDPRNSSGSYYNASIGYDCSCSNARKVSLMGASDYCLAPGARYSAKCGNQMLGELGECPRTGAQPCSDLGHVLTEDAACELDAKDDVYKCVAGRDDQDIQSGKKKKKKETGSTADGGDVGNGARASTGPLSASVLAMTVVVLFGGVVF